MIDIKNLPNQSGCYLFKDKNNIIIYVGKAKNIKKRVSQYFNASFHSPKTQLLIKKINSVDVETTPNEVDALLLESTLINKFNPKYNIKIKNSFLYPYIQIYTSKKGIEIKRSNNPTNWKNAFGPYPDGYSFWKTVSLIRAIFPVNKCLKPSSKKPCLHYSLNKCLGYCFKVISKKEEQIVIDDIKSFLKGNISKVKTILLTRLGKNIDDLNFEIAKETKEMLKNLENVSLKQNVIFKNSKHIDIVGYFHNEENILSITTIHIRFGRMVLSSNDIFVCTIQELDDFIHQYIFKKYKNNESVEEILLQKHFEVLEIALKKHILVPKTGVKLNLMKNAIEDAKQKIATKNIKAKIQNQEQALSFLSQIINHKKIEEIEMFDISNLGSSNLVGVSINYDGIEFNKSKYRKYIIKNIKIQNDYLAMNEVAERHFNSKLKNNEEIPSLLLIDGKYQVNLIEKSLKKLNINIPIIGIVKNERHKTSALFYKNEKFSIENNHIVKNFVENLQDEVHRFAITFHRKKRQEELLNSYLTRFTFLTNNDINELYQNLNTIRQIKIAKQEDLVKIIGVKKAKKLWEEFNKKDEN